MNEICLINTAKIRWLKTQEIYSILKDPPINFLVDKLPTKPSNGDIFILDSKTIKRKWKQDGWTYMPRKQGIGFREDNENLRIGGENAITCYYSYIINGLLEGEEKIIVMNRRIYKLFPDGQYFLVHYLKDNPSNTNNLPIKDSTSTPSSQNGNHEVDNSKQNNQMNTYNEQQMINLEESSYLSNTSSNAPHNSAALSYVSSTNTQETVDKYSINNKPSAFFIENENLINHTSPSITVDFKLNRNISSMDEEIQNISREQKEGIESISQQQYQSLNVKQNEGYQLYNNLQQYNNISLNNNINNQNQVKLNGRNYSQQQYVSNQQVDIDNQLKTEDNIENNTTSQNNNIKINSITNFAIIPHDDQHQYDDVDDFNNHEWQNVFGNSSDNQFKTHINTQNLNNKNYSSNSYQTNNNIQSINPNPFQSLDIEPHFDELNYDNNPQLDRFQNQYSSQTLSYNNNNISHNKINRNIINNNSNCNLEINNNNNNTIKNNKNNINNEQNGINYINDNKTYTNGQINANINSNNTFYQSNNQRFQSNQNQMNQDSQLIESNENTVQQDILVNQLIQGQNNNDNLNMNMNGNNNLIQQNNTPSYSKLQERIIELEQRLHKLEFDKKSDYEQSSQIGLNSSQQSSSLNQSQSNPISNIHNDDNNYNTSSTQNNNNSQYNPSFYNNNETPQSNQFQQQQQQLNTINQQQQFIQQNQQQQQQQQIQYQQQQNQQQNKQSQQNYIQLNQFYTANPYSFNLDNQSQQSNQNETQNNQQQQQFNNKNFIHTQTHHNQQKLCQNGISNQLNQIQPENQFLYSNKQTYQQHQKNDNINQKDDFNQQQQQYLMNQQQQQQQEQQQQLQQNNEIINQIQEEEGQKRQITDNNNKSLKKQEINNSGMNQIPPIKVTEYSPEWDYTKGGSKMVLCFLPALNNLSEYQKSKFQIGFGLEKVPAYCIQPGVLKCFVPPHEKGLVKLQIYLENQRIDDIEDKASYFEFRNQEKKKKKQSKKVIFNQDDEFYRNEFKVRIIDKLNSIQDFISQTGNNSNKTNSSSGYGNTHQQSQLIDNIANLDESCIDNNQKTEIDLILDSVKMNIENLDKISFDALLTKILAISEQKLKRNQIKKWLDQVDENGYGIIHYIVILGFDTTLTILNEYECSLNLKSRNSITPLQLAFALNQEKIVEILIKSGALGEKMNEQIKEGEIKGGDIQQLSSLLNFGAIYQSRNILDMLVREVTLHDSINNSNLTNDINWNDQEGQEDNYLDLKDLCQNANEDDLIKNLNAISNQLKHLQKKRKRRQQRNKSKKQNINNQEGEQYSMEEFYEMDQEEVDDYEDEYDEEEEEDDDGYYDEDEEEDENEYEGDEYDDYTQNYRNKQQNKQYQQSHDNLEKSNKKHKYLRNYSEINKVFKEKQRENQEFDEKDEELYKSQNYQCRIKTIQKNVRGWLLRRQYLDIKYATRVLQNYIRQKIAKKHIKPECKSMIKNKLIDWLSIKH